MCQGFEIFVRDLCLLAGTMDVNKMYFMVLTAFEILHLKMLHVAVALNILPNLTINSFYWKYLKMKNIKTKLLS